MAATLDRLLDQFERGQISRRQLLQGLALATGGALVGNAQTGQAMDAPLGPAMSLNHVHLEVHDIKRTMEFYSTVLGARPKETTGPKNQTMYLPGARPGFGSWMSLTQIGADAQAGINHVAYGTRVPQSKYPEIAEELKKRFPDLKPPRTFISEAAGMEIYFYDPDGISLQLIQMDHNGELTGYSKETGEKLKK